MSFMSIFNRNGKSYAELFNKLKGDSASSCSHIQKLGGRQGEAKARTLLDYRFSGEADALQDLEEKLGLKDYYGIFEDHKEISLIRQDLLGNSVRMNELLAPRLYRICREVSEKIGYGREIEFYISSSPEMNALSIHGFQKESDIIVLTSSLIKLMGDDELRFVIGHEMGHLVFQHSQPHLTYFKVYGGKDNFNPVGNNLKLRWNLYSEISADRIGFLAAGDIRTVGGAFFKLASGLSEEHLNFNLEEYLKQLDHLDSGMSGEALSASHPATLVRLKCLDIFISSSLFSKFCEIGKEGISDRELLDATWKTLSLMEILPIDEVELESAKLIGVAGTVLAHSSGELIETQYDFVYAALLYWTTTPEFFMDFESPEVAFKELEKCCLYWAERNNPEKFSLFKWIIRIAIEDNKLNENEKILLHDIGYKMLIPEKDIDDYIRQVIAEKNR